MDHRGEPGNVNAHTYGNTSNTGASRYTFGICKTGTAIGIGVDSRIVLHEFGHQVLLDRIHSLGFGFAHNGGDSIGAIIHDPESQLIGSDRFLTFPWISRSDRRHDREVSAGWGWGGSVDLGDDADQYQREQILSSTLFRIYRSIGGDSFRANLSQRRAVRHFAERQVLYLFFMLLLYWVQAP